MYYKAIDFKTSYKFMIVHKLTNLQLYKILCKYGFISMETLPDMCKHLNACKNFYDRREIQK